MIRIAIFATFAAAMLVAPAAAQTVPAERRNVISQSERAAIPTGSILRIEANIASRVPRWSGVRSCNRRSRAESAMRSGFDRWAREQRSRRPQQRYIGGGWAQGRWWYSNGRRASGSRYCRGGFRSAPAYVEFVRGG